MLNCLIKHNTGTKEIYNFSNYDKSGNPLTDGLWSFDWEGRELVKAVRRDDQGNVLQQIEYKYNDQGYRTYKKVSIDANNYDEFFYYLEGSNVLQEKIKHVVNEVSTTDVIYYTYDVDGRLISMSLNGEEYWYLRNIQGDVTGLLDKNGIVVVEYQYDAYGNILNDYKATDISGVNLAEKNPIRYRGYRYDEETSWYYLNSRYYNSELGRFINADGLIGGTGDLLGYNMYAYTANNPVNRADHSGYFWDYILDAASIYFSYKQFRANPCTDTFLSLAADVILGVVPIVTAGVGYAKYLDEIGDVSKGVRNTERGLDYGRFYSIKNSAGGELYISRNSIIQKDFEDIVFNARGNVNIFTGVHGDLKGGIEYATKFYYDDLAKFGNLPNVKVYDMNGINYKEMHQLINSSDTSIFAWCNSELFPWVQSVR